MPSLRERRNMRVFGIGIIAGLCFLLTADYVQAEFKVGVGKRIITPDPLLPVSGGLGIPRETTQKKGDLSTRALVFQNEKTTVAIVSLDLLGFPSVLGDRIRKKVKRISPKNIMFCASHTHSAPDCYAFPDGKGGHTANMDYIDFVCKKAAEAINEALDNLQPAAIRVATDKAAEGIAYNYYAPSLYDRRMSVIQAVSTSGKTIATLVNYGTHPEVIGSSQGILSPDVIGPMYDKLDKETGGMTIFVNSAQGGMVSADNRNLNSPSDARNARWNDFNTWEECLRIGHLMASEAARIIKKAPLQKSPRLGSYNLDITFPVESDMMWMIVKYSPLKYPHNEKEHTITTQVNVLNLGNAQILTIPGEALPNIGFYLKRKMKGEHNLLFGLTNDAFGYMLTKVDFNSFPRYEYVSQTSLGEQTGEIFIEKSLEFIETLPRPIHLKQK